MPAYKRILLKLSGEAMGAQDGTFHLETVERVAEEIGKVCRLGVEMGIVIGGGNIIRGSELERFGLDRIQSDSMGMLATIINSILLEQVLLSQGIPSVLQSALPIETVAESVTLSRTVSYLREGRVVIFAGGTGSPYFTTDTAAALRACEIGDDALNDACDEPTHDADDDGREDVGQEAQELIEHGLHGLQQTFQLQCAQDRGQEEQEDQPIDCIGDRLGN